MGGGEGSKILEQIQGRPLYEQKFFKRRDTYRGKQKSYTCWKIMTVLLRRLKESKWRMLHETSKKIYHKIKVFQRQEDLRKSRQM